MKKPSQFRTWLMEKWVEHKDECFTWTRKFPEYDDKYYFRKHKWFLRKMYREEKGNV